MNRSVVVFLAAALALVLAGDAASESYELSFSSYLGGSDWEHARDVAADRDGNVYLVGGTASSDFPTTQGAYSRRLATGGSQSFGPCDVFVAKFASDGQLIWSTYIGGPSYDRAYAVEVDDDGYVYVAGRAGPGFPVKNAFQPDFNGVDNGSYGMQNAFVLKLLPDGSDLVWSSYVGVSTLCRDLAIDSEGNVYVPGGRWSTQKVPPAEWFAKAYQKTPPGGESDGGVIKIKGDGSGVLWATWLGGSGDDSPAASIRVDDNGFVYAALYTLSADIPTTPGAFDSSYNGGADYYVAKLNQDGSDLVFGTYLGGSGNEWISTHNLSLDAEGNAYAAFGTSSLDFVCSEGAFQRAFRGGDTDWFVAKLSPSGALLAGTYIGGGAGENADGLYVADSGDVFITGETQSTDFPVSSDPYQSVNKGGGEGVLVMLSADFKRLLYSTYIGGPSDDNGRTGFLDRDGNLYVAGSVSGSGWPVKDAYQSSFAGGTLDNIVAKFSPANVITLNAGITYQTITGWEVTAFVAQPKDPAFPNYKDTVFDMAVNDVGITRVRLETRSGVENDTDNWSDYQAGVIDYQTWRSRRYATVNDDNDPCNINWAGFHFSEMDWTVENVVLPTAQLMKARGQKLYINVNYVAFTGQISGDGGYMHDDPAEYAEFVLATYQHLQSKYDFVPDAWEVILEPDNVSQWDGNLLGRAIVAAASRLRANGFDPVFIAPSNTNMGGAITYFDQMIQVPGVLPYLREFSYHRYGGVSLQNLQTIASRAKQYGIGTSMLEWWSGGNTYRTLHEDLKTGNNSAWQEAAVRGLFEIDESDPCNTSVTVGDKTKFTRQYYKFVRPGAVRIEAASTEAEFDPLAFVNADGGYVVVVKCETSVDLSIRQLPAGSYGIKYTTAGQYDVDLPDRIIGSAEALTASIPAPGVLTVYARAASSDSEPPSVPVGATATAGSASRINLSWTPSTDNVGVAGYRIYRDDAAVGFSSTNSYSDGALASSTTYTYRITAYDAAGNESGKSPAVTAKTQEQNLQDGLIGYWRFEEAGGVAAADSSGAGNDGTVFGASRGPGRMGQALDFDGVDDYVRIAGNPALNNMGALTMAAWVYPRADSHWHVLDKGDGDKRIYAEGTNLTLVGRVRYNGEHAYSTSAGNTLTLDTWQHVALTWSLSENVTRLYHNGVETGYVMRGTGSGGVLNDSDYPYVIGARGALGDVTFFDGLIDEVRLYDRVLSDQEVLELYRRVPSERAGDLDDDFDVDFEDVLFFSLSWLWTGVAGSIPEDIIIDGNVSFVDFAGLASNWKDRWNRPPFVEITSPSDGATIGLRPGEVLVIEAEAHDVDGSVEKVEFLTDGIPVFEDGDGEDGWRAGWADYTLGDHTLVARATDNEEAAATSAPVQVTLAKPPR